jgi:NADH-quinone oxidoreductase subunit M
MSPREIAVMAPLVILTILFGFYPAPILDVTAQSVNRLVASHTAALKKSRADNAPRVVIAPPGLRETPSQPAR